MRCEPSSQCWTQHGKLYCGCKGGQLLGVDVDTSKVTLLFNPKVEKQRQRTKTLTLLHRATAESLVTEPIEEETAGIESVCISMEC